MKVIDYQRHCALLFAAALIVMFLGKLPTPTWISEPIFLFGLIGPLHALAIVASLKRKVALLRRIVFVCITALLSVLAPILGFMLAATVSVAGGFAFFLALVLASVFGASTYWLLIRWSWIGTLSYSSLRFTVVLCALTMPIAFIGAATLTGFGLRQEGVLLLIADAMPTISWWCAFSYSLYRSETHGRGANHVLQQKREDARA